MIHVLCLYFRLAQAALITVIQQTRRSAPQPPVAQLGSYTLVRSRYSSHTHFGVSIGEYRKGNALYLIKTWSGQWKNLKYFSLLHEFYATQALYRTSKRLRYSEQQVTFSEPVELIRTDRGFSAVYRFVEGKLLSTYPPHLQQPMLDAVIQALGRLSRTLRPRDRIVISTRRFFFYAGSLMYVFFLALLTRKLPLASGVVSVAGGIIALRHLLRTPIILSHRDIDLQHVIVGEKTLTLVDCEHMVLTYDGYDSTLIALRYPNLSGFTQHPFFKQYVRLFQPVR